MANTTKTPSERALHTFRTDCAGHQMEIRHDDGLYRHVSFRKPGTGLYWYDLLTAPGILTYRGDWGTWTWAREQDMFEFFRRPGGERINPSYWSEKLLADDVHTRHRGFSEQKFRAEVIRQFWDERARLGDGARDVWEGIREDVLSPFVDLSDEREAVDAAYRFALGGFEFWNVEEWDVKEYSHQYLVALHAIVDGIARYDATTAAAQPLGQIAA